MANDAREQQWKARYDRAAAIMRSCGIDPEKYLMPRPATELLAQIKIAHVEAQTPGSDTTAFRDAVILGLRERGWPEPERRGGTPAFPLFSGAYWPDYATEDRTVFLQLREDSRSWEVIYETADDLETGVLLFDSVSPERIVEAIDRLRWVLGLPPRWIKRWEPGSSELDKLFCQQGPIFVMEDRPPPTFLGAPHPGCSCPACKEARMIAHMMRTADPAAEARNLMKCLGAVQGLHPAVRRKIDEGAAKIDAALQHVEGQINDTAAGLVPLPAKPGPAPEPAYVPTRWIGGEE